MTRAPRTASNPPAVAPLNTPRRWWVCSTTGNRDVRALVLAMDRVEARERFEKEFFPGLKAESVEEAEHNETP